MRFVVDGPLWISNTQTPLRVWEHQNDLGAKPGGLEEA